LGSVIIGTDESDFVSCSEGEADIKQYRLGGKVATEVFDRENDFHILLVLGKGIVPVLTFLATC